RLISIPARPQRLPIVSAGVRLGVIRVSGADLEGAEESLVRQLERVIRAVSVHVSGVDCRRVHRRRVRILARIRQPGSGGGWHEDPADSYEIGAVLARRERDAREDVVTDIADAGVNGLKRRAQAPASAIRTDVELRRQVARIVVRAADTGYPARIYGTGRHAQLARVELVE